MKRRHLVFSTPALLAAGIFTSTAARASVNVLRFGQSADLSGPNATVGREVRDGIQAAFLAASKTDAARGIRYELTTLDDGGSPQRCATHVNTLLDGGASALIGLTSGLGAEASMPAIAASQAPLLGAASGTMALRNGSGAAFHVRAGLDAEYKRMASYVKDFGMRRVALVHLADAAHANLAAMASALKLLSVSPVDTLSIDGQASSYTDVAERLLAAKPDLVVFSTPAGPAAAVIDHMTAARYPGLFYASSSAGQSLVDTLTRRQQSCIMSMVVPRPNAAGVNVVAACRQDLAALRADTRLGMSTLEGYIAGRVAVEAARAALKVGGGERVSRARMKESLAGVRTDLGGYRVEFGPGVTQGSQYVDLAAIDRWGRFVG